MECTAYSIPAPDRVVWTFNGREVDIHDHEYSILEDPLPEGIKSTLIVRESQQRHFGVYNCSVSNAYGSDMVEISLVQQSEYHQLVVFGKPLFSFFRRKLPHDGDHRRCHRGVNPSHNRGDDSFSLPARGKQEEAAGE